jgi:type IV secretory pathway VirB10-like protein
MHNPMQMAGSGISSAVDITSGNMLQYFMGFLAIVGVGLVILGFISGSTSIVIAGAVIIILALIMFVLISLLSTMAAAKETVETARQAKDLVDETFPNAIPTARRVVDRGLQAVRAQPQQQVQAQPQYTRPPPQPPAPAPAVPQVNAPQAPAATEVPTEEPVYYGCPTCGAGNTYGTTYCHFCKRPLTW